ncbi:MAG TPA: GNAT family N-acetyltransferase [Pyrinomonadaceae bacterium]|nr:GNAT family N-acetyltransferase [Pyrinomonadaceae bacterium]
MKSAPAQPHECAVSLRPVAPEDERLLLEIYAGTRAEELAQVPWGEAQREAFLRMQLAARDRSYRMYYAGLEDSVILFNGRAVGRLLVVRGDEEFRLADIALLPEYRRAGIGTALVRELMEEAGRLGKPLRLQVEKPNAQALRLYERLGFATTGENDTHFQMEHRPA